jgi:hypothetical protein
MKDTYCVNSQQQIAFLSISEAIGNYIILLDPVYHIISYFEGFLQYMLLCVTLCCRRHATTDRIAANFVSAVKQH